MNHPDVLLFHARSQGAVGDCWFLAGLAVVSERPDLIARVLGGNDGPVSDRSGCFEVNLFKDGRWERFGDDSRWQKTDLTSYHEDEAPMMRCDVM